MGNAAEELDDLLHSPSVSLSSVFASRHFWIGCQAGNPALLDYLFSPAIIDQIFGGIFDHRSAMSSAFARLLTAEHQVIQTRVAGSKPVAVQLQAFFRSDNPHVHQPKIAGIFATIVTQILHLASGAIEADLPGLPDFLVHNLTTIAYRRLLTTLLISHPRIISLSTPLFESLLAGATDQNRLCHTLLLIRAVVAERPISTAFLASTSLITSLLNFASTADCTLFNSLNALEIVRISVDANTASDVSELVSSFENRFASIIQTTDCRLPVLLTLFPSRLFLHIDDFVLNKVSTFYGKAFVATVWSLKIDFLCGFIESSGILSKIIDAFGHSKTNGHLLQLGYCLHTRSHECELLTAEPWRSFLTSSLLPRFQQMTPGARRPTVRASRSFGEEIKLMLATKPAFPPPLDEDIGRIPQVPQVDKSVKAATTMPALPPTPLACMKRLRGKGNRPKRMSDGSENLPE
jgi:hypothetical protein